MVFASFAVADSCRSALSAPQAVMDVLKSPGGMDRKAKAIRQSQPRGKRKGSKAPPVDAKQAARGKVDSVKVSNMLSQAPRGRCEQMPAQQTSLLGLSWV